MFQSETSLCTVQPATLLPFRVEIITRRDLQEVAALRAETYGKHLPDLAASLNAPEPADYARGCEVFVARSKLDGTLLGTLRTHANVFNPLPLQASIELPEVYRGTRMVETTRLCVKSGMGSSTVRNALFKAMHQYCLSQRVDWMVVAARRHVDRIHDSLLFSDVKEPGVYYPMAHAGGVPHRVLRLAPVDAEPLWHAKQHPLYDFAFKTRHPDIDISMAQDLNFDWQCPDSGATVTYLPERRLKPRMVESSANTQPIALRA